MKRRLDKRIPILLVFIFFVAFSLSFIKNNHIDSTEAASFNAGNIISNYVMGNYNSMSVSEIQAFLDSKSRCNTANLSGGYYSGNQYVKNLNRTYYWHLDDNGNFICLNREKFDDEGKIGTGKTAAELIYEFAQEYKINPQVILVLLQKEQGLLTDPYPNNFDYGWALGFGAYDYGEWNTKYAGFKEQLRAAFDFYSWFVYEYDEDEAWWSVDPEKSEYYIRLGQSNILYNPDYSCGADLVYIENTATVSLYVYTPYQPNSIVRSGQLDEVCGAYGNWNFFNYFNSYFGDPTGNSAIKQYYKTIGGTNSYMGNSVSEEKCGLIKNGCYQNFEVGRIYYTPATGAWDISGKIYQKWYELGTEWSELGYPTSSEQKDENGIVYQQFENGRIYYQDGQTWVIY